MPRKRVLPCWRSFSNAGTTSSSTVFPDSDSPPPLVVIALCRWKMSTCSRPMRCQAGLQRFGDRGGDAAEIGGPDAHLGADDDVGLQLRQHAAKVLLGLAVAVHRGGVEVVHTHFQCARDGAFLILRRAAHHQAAHRAATEAQDRNPQARSAKCPHFHVVFSRSVYRGYSPAARALTLASATTRSSVGVATPAMRASSNGASKMPSISIGRPSSRSCNILGL